MLDAEKIAKINIAKAYYYFFLHQLLLSKSSGFVQADELSSIFFAAYKFKPDSPSGGTHIKFIALTTLDFARNRYATVIEDDFADTYLEANEATENLGGHAKFNEIVEKYENLGSEGYAWLRSAFFKIGRAFSVEELNEYQKLTESKDEAEPVIANFSDTPNEEDNEIDSWSPLQINREDASTKSAIEATESALKEIESSNGYAATEPEERNAIVLTIRGTLDAIKTGFPSKPAIISGLLAPLKFIAKKFSEASMGEAAKIAVAAIIKWLF